MNGGWRLAPLLLALAAAITAAGCGGPDCNVYCAKLVQCGQQQAIPQSVDQAACLLGCNDSSASRGDTIQCYIDHSCSDIEGGHCSVTGKKPG